MTPCDPSRPFVTPPISMISVTIRVSSERNAKMKRNGREKIFFAKNEKFFLFAGNPSDNFSNIYRFPYHEIACTKHATKTVKKIFISR